jgi:hypothetical protein
LQNNNGSNSNKSNGPKDASDEILDILNNYQKTHSQSEQLEAPIPDERTAGSRDDNRRWPDNGDTIIIDSPRTRNNYTAHAENTVISDRVMSHFADEDQVELADSSYSSHFSDAADKKVLMQAQKKNREARLQKEKKPKK